MKTQRSSRACWARRSSSLPLRFTARPRLWPELGPRRGGSSCRCWRSREPHLGARSGGMRHPRGTEYHRPAELRESRRPRRGNRRGDPRRGVESRSDGTRALACGPPAFNSVHARALAHCSLAPAGTLSQVSSSSGTRSVRPGSAGRIARRGRECWRGRVRPRSAERVPSAWRARPASLRPDRRVLRRSARTRPG